MQNPIHPIKSFSLKGERRLAKLILEAAIEDHKAKLARNITESSSVTSGMKRKAAYLRKRVRELHSVRVSAQICRGYMATHQRDLIPAQMPEFYFLRSGIQEITWRPVIGNHVQRAGRYRRLWAMLHHWLGVYEQRELELLDQLRQIRADLETERKERAVVDPTAFLFSPSYGGYLKFWCDVAGVDIEYLRRKIQNHESRVNIKTIGDQARALMAGQ